MEEWWAEAEGVEGENKEQIFTKKTLNWNLKVDKKRENREMDISTHLKNYWWGGVPIKSNWPGSRAKILYTETQYM